MAGPSYPCVVCVCARACACACLCRIHEDTMSPSPSLPRGSKCSVEPSRVAHLTGEQCHPIAVERGWHGETALQLGVGS